MTDEPVLPEHRFAFGRTPKAAICARCSRDAENAECAGCEGRYCEEHSWVCCSCAKRLCFQCERPRFQLCDDCEFCPLATVEDLLSMGSLYTRYEVSRGSRHRRSTSISFLGWCVAQNEAWNFHNTAHIPAHRVPEIEARLNELLPERERRTR